jgi:hypothetical protein
MPFLAQTLGGSYLKMSDNKVTTSVSIYVLWCFVSVILILFMPLQIEIELKSIINEVLFKLNSDLRRMINVEPRTISQVVNIDDNASANVSIHILGYFVLCIRYTDRFHVPCHAPTASI